MSCREPTRPKILVQHHVGSVQDPEPWMLLQQKLQEGRDQGLKQKEKKLHKPHKFLQTFHLLVIKLQRIAIHHPRGGIQTLQHHNLMRLLLHKDKVYIVHTAYSLTFDVHYLQYDDFVSLTCSWVLKWRQWSNNKRKR